MNHILGVTFVLLWMTVVVFSDSRRNFKNTDPLEAKGLGVFDVVFDEPVALWMKETSHYVIDTSDGEEEWSRIIPGGPAGHVVYVRDRKEPSVIRPYTVTLFHQLKCLDVVRRQYNLLLGSNGSQTARPLTRHCLNYMRQTLWCKPNLYLESTRGSLGTASRSYDAVCKDWTRVYDEAAANRRAYDESSH